MHKKNPTLLYVTTVNIKFTIKESLKLTKGIT